MRGVVRGCSGGGVKVGVRLLVTVLHVLSDTSCTPLADSCVALRIAVLLISQPPTELRSLLLVIALDRCSHSLLSVAGNGNCSRSLLSVERLLSRPLLIAAAGDSCSQSLLLVVSLGGCP